MKKLFYVALVLASSYAFAEHLTSRNASNLTTGTLPDGRLSSNVPLLNASNTFTTQNTFTGLVLISTPSSASSDLSNVSTGYVLYVASKMIVGGGDYLQTGSLRRYANGRVSIGGGFSLVTSGSPGGEVFATSANFFLRAHDPGVQWNDISMQNSGGSVGIGNTTPAQKLQVTGNVDVTGTLTKGGGSFKIPHPTKEDKWLYHGFVESPEFLLIYRGSGKLVLGSTGIALPDYFKFVNSTQKEDVTVYLSPRDGWSPLWYVQQDIQNGVLTVKTTVLGDQSQEFDWIVMGRRNDPWVNDPENQLTKGTGKLVVEQDISDELRPGNLSLEQGLLKKDSSDPQVVRNAIQRKRAQYFGYKDKYSLPPDPDSIDPYAKPKK